MDESQNALLKILSKALFKRDFDLFEPDWSKILSEAKSQAVVQLTYEALDKSIFSPEEAKQWKLASSADIANNIRVGYNHSLLHKWMINADIPYVVLKGVSSAFYYPIPSFRSMGDVDFLVKPEDLGKAGKILEEHGLKPWKKDHDSHIVYQGPRMHYEMHFKIAGIPNGTAGDLVREYMQDIFEKAESEVIVNGNAMLPSPFHHGLILLLHTCHHLTGEGVGLRHLCDWAVFVNSFSEDAFCELFEEKLKRLGLFRFAQILTRVSIKYLGSDDKEWATCDDELASLLMEDIFAGGNFGNKDNNRVMQRMLISQRGKEGVGNSSLLKEFVTSSNKIVYHKWPLAKRIKLIVPIGWVFFGAQRFIRERMGKRSKTNVKEIVGGAVNRREIYRRFHLYEGEVQ